MQQTSFWSPGEDVTKLISDHFSSSREKCEERLTLGSALGLGGEGGGRGSGLRARGGLGDGHSDQRSEDQVELHDEMRILKRLGDNIKIRCRLEEVDVDEEGGLTSNE